MSHGYNGKILHVDLTSGLLSVEEPDQAFYRKYMGGSAMAMYYLTNLTFDFKFPFNFLSNISNAHSNASVSASMRVS